MSRFSRWFGNLVLFLIVTGLSVRALAAFPPGKDLYQIRIYHFTKPDQQQKLDKYLKNDLIPAAHRTGIKAIGVYKPLANDTSMVKSIYVLVPFSSNHDLLDFDAKLAKDPIYLEGS